MGANKNFSLNLAYIPKSTQIHSTKLLRAVERKADNQTHAVMRLGEKLGFKRRAHDCKTRVHSAARFATSGSDTAWLRTARDAGSEKKKNGAEP
jgi:hypothetical protein